MKQRYDKRAIVREFNPGDCVLVLVPVMGAALQPCYRGPYVVVQRVNNLNYVISTPDRKKENYNVSH